MAPPVRPHGSRLGGHLSSWFKVILARVLPSGVRGLHRLAKRSIMATARAVVMLLRTLSTCWAAAPADTTSSCLGHRRCRPAGDTLGVAFPPWSRVVRFSSSDFPLPPLPRPAPPWPRDPRRCSQCASTEGSVGILSPSSPPCALSGAAWVSWLRPLQPLRSERIAQLRRVDFAPAVPVSFPFKRQLVLLLSLQ